MSRLHRALCSFLVLTLFSLTPILHAGEERGAALLEAALPHLYGYTTEINWYLADQYLRAAAAEENDEAKWLLYEMVQTTKYYNGGHSAMHTLPFKVSELSDVIYLIRDELIEKLTLKGATRTPLDNYRLAEALTHKFRRSATTETLFNIGFIAMPERSKRYDGPWHMSGDSEKTISCYQLCNLYDLGINNGVLLGQWILIAQNLLTSRKPHACYPWLIPGIPTFRAEELSQIIHS